GGRGLEVDRGAVPARGVRLLLRRAPPHHEQGVDALSRGREGNCLRVVARGGGDHSALALLGRQVAQLVQRAARLERAGALEELALQARAERSRRERWR